MSFSQEALSVGVSISLFIILAEIYKFYFRSRKLNLSNRTVLITGASSGLGQECAKAFYKLGAKVILCSRRRQQLEIVKNELKNFPPSTKVTFQDPIICVMDLENTESIQVAVRSLLMNGEKIDVLVNNAGIGFRGDVLETNTDVDLKVMRINYLGQVALVKEILPSMVKEKFGHIIAISSIQGKLAIPNRSSYSASKHALQAFHDSLRAECSELGVKVSVISPGYIRTPFSLNAVTGSGSKYGEMDDATQNGMDPAYVAKRVVEVAMSNKDNDIIIGKLIHCIAAKYIRPLFPNFMFKILAKKNIKKSL